MLNRAEVIGNLGNDPEIRTFSDGGRIANISVATTMKWRDKNTGETREKTEWHRIVIKSSALAGVAEKYLRKGSKVFISGRLETRKWQDQSGNDRYSTEIVVSGFDGKLTMLGDPRGSDGGGGYRAPDRGGAGALDDEIPF